jgi:hypothetical protein
MLGPRFIYLYCHSYVLCRGSFVPVKQTYVEKLTVALGQNAWEAHVTSIDCLFEAGFADLAGT